jgi:hypothetical protein
MSQVLGRSDTGELLNLLGSVTNKPRSGVGQSRLSAFYRPFRRLLNLRQALTTTDRAADPDRRNRVAQGPLSTYGAGLGARGDLAISSPATNQGAGAPGFSALTSHNDITLRTG